jgi:hypothetical protein
VVTFEQNAKLFEPGSFNMSSLDGIISDYNSKKTHTPQEEMMYQNAAAAKQAIEAQTKVILKKAGLTDEEMTKIMPYIGMKGPELWNAVTQGSKYVTPEITKKLAEIQAIKEKTKSVESQITKTIEDNNRMKIDVIPIDPTSNVGKLQTAIGQQLAAKSADVNFMKPNENPEWSKLNLRMDNHTGFFGSLLGGNSDAITTPADISQYLIPVSTTRSGSSYTVEYKIDQAKLAKEGKAIEDVNTGDAYNGTFKIKYDNSNATEVEDYAIKNYSTVTPSVAKVLKRSDGIASSIDAQLTSGFYPGENANQLDENNVLPTTIALPGSNGKAYATVTKVPGTDEYTEITLHLDGQPDRTVRNYAAKYDDGTYGPFTKDEVVNKLTEFTKAYNQGYWKNQSSKNTIK